MRTPALVASLYAALMLGATPAPALTPEAAQALSAARQGEMARLIFHRAPRPLGNVTFADASGAERTPADWQNKVVFMNFWATWCPPCLKEMPSINRMAAALQGDDFAVVAISTDRGSPDKPIGWMAQNGIDTLDFYHDSRFRAATAAKVMGQPTTLILDRDGAEIARLTGDVEWDSPDALAILKAVIAATAPAGG
jgi:thiol-disulfide isomerase/thioredoxin